MNQSTAKHRKQQQHQQEHHNNSSSSSTNDNNDSSTVSSSYSTKGGMTTSRYILEKVRVLCQSSWNCCAVLLSKLLRWIYRLTRRVQTHYKSTKTNSGGGSVGASSMLYGIAILILSYCLLFSMIHTMHIYTTTSPTSSSSSLQAQQQLQHQEFELKQLYTKHKHRIPFLVTRSEQEILSGIMGRSIQQSKSFFTSFFVPNNENSKRQQQQQQQCPMVSSTNFIQIPPPLIRKGKSRYETYVQYQTNAIALVNNIRILLGTVRHLSGSGGGGGVGSTSVQQQLLGENWNSTNINSSGSSTTSSSHNNNNNIFHDAIIMDYGCGSGRLLMGLLFASFVEEQEQPFCFQKYIGVDVNRKEIQWLTKTYSGIRNTRRGPTKTPTTGKTATVASNANMTKSTTTTTTTSNLKQRLQQQMRRRRNQLLLQRQQQQQEQHRRLQVLSSNINPVRSTSTIYDRLEFVRVNVYNERYNRNGYQLDTDSIQLEDRMILPMATYTRYMNSIDIMVVRSVFTYMVSSDIYHHLRVLYFLLKPNTGMMIVSLLINPIPHAPAETTKSYNTNDPNNNDNNNNSTSTNNSHNVYYISKQVFENILYETGYTILFYMTQWNGNEDVYIISPTNGKKQQSLLLLDDMNNDHNDDNTTSSDEEDVQGDNNEDGDA